MIPERPAGCSKRPSSKAAGDARTGGVPSGYVEDSCELRTKLAAFFSILLVRWREHRDNAQRTSGPAGNFHRQGDHVESTMWKIA
jgi:hypothetical protein